MRAKKAFHVCFFTFFIIGECLMAISLVAAIAKDFTAQEIRVLHWAELIMFLLLVVFIFLVSSIWKVRLFGKMGETIAVTVVDAFVILIAGIAWFALFVISGSAFVELRHSCAFQFAAYVWFYSDVMFVRPLLRDAPSDGGE